MIAENYRKFKKILEFNENILVEELDSYNDVMSDFEDK